MGRKGDARGAFVDKWASRDTSTPGGGTGALRTEGTRYVAAFDDDPTGAWVAPTPDATGMDPATIAVFTRTAASAVGATTMDRPEWLAANPTAAMT